MKKSILFISRGGINNPSYRIRAHNYKPFLTKDGFFTEDFFIRYGGKISINELKKLYKSIQRNEIIFIQRITGWYLYILLKLMRKKIILDIDDSLHYIRHTQQHEVTNPDKLTHYLKIFYRTIFRGSKYYSNDKFFLFRLIRISDLVIAGNRTLYEYFKPYSRRICIIPSTVHADKYPVKEHTLKDILRIGWIGVKGNLDYIDDLNKVFSYINKKFKGKLILSVVSNGMYKTESINVENIEWNLEKESEHVLNFDIGIMPLRRDIFSVSKCSFKAILCMAHGIPVVASDIGMNKELIENGVNGFLAEKEEDWVDYLTQLIEDTNLRKNMGKNARKAIIEKYSNKTGYEKLKNSISKIFG